MGLKVKNENGTPGTADEHHKVTLPMISKAVIPMIIACLIVLILITYVPKISLFLIGQ